MSTSETQPAATGWSLLMPSTWSRIRLRTDRREQVSALVGRAFGSISRDQGPALRRALERELLSWPTRPSTAAGGSSTSSRRSAGDCRWPPPAWSRWSRSRCRRASTPRSSARVLANAPGSEPTTVTVGEDVVPAVRRSEPKRFRSQEEGAEPFKVTFTGLDVYVPFPDGSQILLLTFRTPMEQIAEPMSVLFEAIAGSLRFREG